MNDSAVNLRQASVDDLDAIMQLETATFPSDAWNRETMQRELRSRVNRYYVLERDDTTVAYGGIRVVACDADVQTIAVADGSRGQGLGRALMEHLIQAARDEGALQMFLEVRADNPNAIALYESLDFEQIDVRHGYYQPDGIDAIVMMKEPV